MRFGDTLWDVFQRKDISRRSFLKTCVTLTGILGLGPNMVAKVVEAARVSAGALMVRILRPGQMVTKEFDPERLNLEVDAAGRIIAARCG